MNTTATPASIARATLGDANPQHSPARMVRNIFETYSAQVLRIAGGVVFNVWLTRLLIPADRGYFGVGMAVATLVAQFGQMGLSTANVYFAAREPKLKGSLLANSFAVSAAVAPVLTMIVVAVRFFAPTAIVLPTSAFIVVLIYIPFGLLYLFLQGLLLGTHQIRRYNANELVNRYVPLAWLAACAFSSSVTPTVALAGVLCGQVVSCFTAWLGLRKDNRVDKISSSLMGKTLRFGARTHLAVVFAFMLFRADLLMVAHMRGAADAGFYSLATSIAEYMSLPAVVVGTVLLPQLSALRNTEAKFSLALRWTIGLGAVMLPLFVIGAFAGHPLIRILFGARYLASYPAFVWLLPGVYFLGMQNIMSTYITSIGYKMAVPAAWGVCAAINLAGNLYAIPQYGIVGASVLSTICYSLAFVLVTLIALQHRKGGGDGDRVDEAAIGNSLGISGA